MSTSKFPLAEMIGLDDEKLTSDRTARLTYFLLIFMVSALIGLEVGSRIWP